MYTSNKPGTIACACTTVKKLSRILVRTYDNALAGCGINITQLAVMRCISRREGEPLARVAEELEMDRTSLYRALTPMQRDGWIKFAAGPDARARYVKLTRRGTDLIANAATRWDGIQNRVVGNFGLSEWDVLVGDMNRLADVVLKYQTVREGGASGT